MRGDADADDGADEAVIPPDAGTAPVELAPEGGEAGAEGLGGLGRGFFLRSALFSRSNSSRKIPRIA